MEGLKDIDTSIKYRLPEEIIQKRKEIELKKNVTSAVLSLCVVVMGVLYFLFNKIESDLIRERLSVARLAARQLDERLRILDRETYREDLKRHKVFNYGISYLALRDLIPSGWQVDSFKFTRLDRWNVELYLSRDHEAFYDPIPRIGLLKAADIKDIFVNDQPGKHLRITI